MAVFEVKVKEIIKETSDSYSVKFDIPEGFEWKAGQFSIWEYVDYKVDEGEKPSRVLSIASCPEDGYLMFSTRVAEVHTSWKEILLNKLKVGDKMTTSAPKGKFAFHDDYKKSFAVAGGIGITPIRSLIKHASENNKEDHKYTIVYSDDSGEYCYDEDFRLIAEKMDNLNIIYVKNREELNEVIKNYVEENKNEAEYLIAGSPGMNKGISNTLIDFGIEKSNIKTDNFNGY